VAQRRPIDVAVQKFYGAVLSVTLGLFGTVALWVGLTRDDNGAQPPYLNTAFVLSWLIAIALTAGILEHSKRRPADKSLTWGEAFLGAAYVFLLLFWIYGVVPHQWLSFADNELNWRVDNILIGPTGLGFTDGEGLVQWLLPFDVTYLVIRDIIATSIYVLGVTANLKLWSIWQARGTVAPTEVEQSTYGRPLVREGV
jgi:hypothetical protein